MKKIPITQGKVAIVDDADYEWLNKFKWSAQKSGNTYYAKTVYNDGNRQVKLYMHSAIMNTPAGMITDHINHNGLDNRRANLREGSYSQNNANQSKISNKASKYKGVTWDNWNNKWKAQITVNYKNHFLGYFDNEYDAGKAYDKACKHFYEQFARTNDERFRVL